MINDGFEVTAKDFGYELEFTVRDADGNIADLTGATAVKLKVTQLGTERALFTADAVIVDASNGKVKYEVQANNFGSAGNYKGVLTTVYGITKELSSAPFYITVSKAA